LSPSSNPHRALLETYLRPQWPRAVLLGLLLLAGIGLQLANPQIAKTFIDHAQAGEPLERLVRIALLFLGVALLTQATVVAETAVAEDLGWRTTNALRADLTRHVLQLDTSFHAEHTAGELIERIDGDVSAIADFFARFVVQVLGSGVFLLGTLALLAREDWRIGLLLGLCALVALLFMARGGGFVGRRAQAARRAAADLSSYLEERLAGLPDIKTTGADTEAMRRLHAHLAERFGRVQRAVMAGALFNTVVGLIFVLGMGGALGLAVLLAGRGALSLGSVFVIFRYTGMLRQPLERLMRQMNSLQQASGGLLRVAELLETRPRIVDGPGRALPDGALAVELAGVWFAYGDQPVLRNVSCSIDPGEVLGLLGRSGSGKTTLGRLLFRLHDPTAGTIRLGGLDSRTLRLDAVRARIGLVTQDVQLFGGTVRDNVTLFDRRISDAQLTAVFAELGLADWLDGLGAGLDTPLGIGGRGLSAGEAQLVALARVFLKDPGLVVLDEASSRLDPATERLLEAAISRLLAGRSSLIIAHRLATIERAQQILILDESGCVAEQGRRAALAADPGSRFARLLRTGLGEALV